MSASQDLWVWTIQARSRPTMAHGAQLDLGSRFVAYEAPLWMWHPDPGRLSGSLVVGVLQYRLALAGMARRVPLGLGVACKSRRKPAVDGISQAFVFSCSFSSTYISTREIVALTRHSERLPLPSLPWLSPCWFIVVFLLGSVSLLNAAGIGVCLLDRVWCRGSLGRSNISGSSPASGGRQTFVRRRTLVRRQAPVRRQAGDRPVRRQALVRRQAPVRSQAGVRAL